MLPRDFALYSEGRQADARGRKGTMKRWAWLVAALYGLIIIALTLPAILLGFAPKVKIPEAGSVFGSAGYWIWLAVMVLGQFALLAVPVRFASRRPVTRGALWPTVLAGGLMAGGLVVAAGWSILETIFREHSPGSWPWLASGGRLRRSC